MDVQRKLVRAYDVGVLLGYRVSTIKRWAKAGQIPGAVYINRHVRFDMGQIEAFIAAGGHRQAPVASDTRRHAHRPAHERERRYVV